MFNKKHCWQINQIDQIKWKKFPSKIIVLVSYNVLTTFESYVCLSIYLSMKFI